MLEDELLHAVLIETERDALDWRHGVPGEYFANWRGRILHYTYFQDESPTLRVTDPSDGTTPVVIRGTNPKQDENIRRQLLALDAYLDSRSHADSPTTAESEWTQERQDRAIADLLRK